MREYQKINTVWERDEKGKIIVGKYATPEFEYLKDAAWVFSEKVDGSNTRVHWDGGASQFGGRTDNAQLHNGLVQHLRDTLTDTNLASVFGKDAATLYGEGYGASIGKGGGLYYAAGQRFVLFDVRVGDYWLKRDAVEDVAQKLGIPVVPVISTCSLATAETIVRNGLTSRWGAFPAEGLVGKPLVELRDRRGERVIVKMKTRDYAHLPAASAPFVDAGHE